MIIFKKKLFLFFASLFHNIANKSIKKRASFWRVHEN